MRWPLFSLLGTPPARIFDRAVSLGGLCEVAFQLRRITRSKRAFPFDWWVTPIASLPRLLQEAPEDLFSEEKITFSPDYPAMPALICHDLLTIHPHEFDHGTNVGDLPHEERAERLISRFRYLQARLHADVREGATLFVRKRLPGRDDVAPETMERRIAGLTDALADLSRDWGLLLIDYPPLRAPPAAILQAQVTPQSDGGDLGSVQGWDRMWRTLPLRVKAGQGRGTTDLEKTLPRKRSLWLGR